MSDKPKDAKSIFLAAVEIQDTAERAAFVERSCGDDAALRQRVEDLLRAYGQSEGPLDKLAAALAPTHLAEPIPEQVGTAIGPYKLMEQIGEGGFGLVFVAEQERPIRRKVALKIIKPGMDTRDVIARFEAERQALALMDHPNIARVLDAGTTDSGRPYFVMELVHGIPITDFCDQSQLTPRERLCLFVDVCNAVQHAHQKGIIHRDIKPSNVLVTLHDDRPEVKVIDFGVAKALHQHLTDRTVYTRFAQIIGTPLYMSPEQAQMSGLDIDTRSDVYSLGVLLYELLTGSTPFDKQRLAQAAYDELLKILREEEPPKPSLRLSQSGDSLPSIAALRKTEPARLSKMFHGDLDWITMKALEKDRRRRYETANGFAADVMRYLNDEPVEASPPSAFYRLRKIARKHRKPVVVLAAIATMLVLAVVGTTWGLLRAKRAEKVADVSKQEAVAALGQVTQARDAKAAALTLASAERDRAERQLAVGLLRPFEFNEKNDDPAVRRSLIDWSAIKESRIKLRVLEIAFENPTTALQIARQAEGVIQSCVGLSPARRAQAIELVSAKQRDSKAHPSSRAAACWLARELGSADLPAFVESYIHVFTNRLAFREHDVYADFVDFSKGHSLPRLFAIRGLDPFIEMVETSTDSNVRDAATAALIDLATQLDPPQVMRACNVLIMALERSPDDLFAVRGLGELGRRLNPAELPRTVHTLIAVLNNASVGYQTQALDELVRLSPQLGPAEISGVGDAMVKALSRPNNFVRLPELTGLAARLQPSQVAQADKALITEFATSKDAGLRTYSAKGLTALASRLESTQVSENWKILAGSLAEPFDSNDEAVQSLRRAITGAMIALAPRLESSRVKDSWDALVALAQKSNLFIAPNGGLTGLAARLEPSHARQSADIIISMLERSNSCDGLLISISPRLDGKQAGRAWNICRARADKRVAESDYENGDDTAIFTAVARHLEPAKVAQVVESLAVAIERCKQPIWLETNIFTALTKARRLNAPQVRRVLKALIHTLETQPVSYALNFFAASNGEALNAQVEGDDLQRLSDALLQALTLKKRDVGLESGAAIELAFLVPRLEGPQVARAAVAVEAMLDKGTPDLMCAPLLHQLGPLLDAATSDKLSTKAAAAVFDHGDSGWNTDEGPSEFDWHSSEVVASITSSRSLAKLLSHPRCLGEFRNALLGRFEELVLHGGEPVFTRPTNSFGKPSTPPPPRRFVNLYDAAAWIQQNWPDFDLEASCPATWRGAD